MASYHARNDWFQASFTTVTSDEAESIIERCIETGEGAHIAIAGTSFQFVIQGRNIPDDAPAKPAHAPLWKDVKDVLTKDAWTFLKNEAERNMHTYMESIRMIAQEKRIMSRLNRIKANVAHI